jgi:hypothetical protein
VRFFRCAAVAIALAGAGACGQGSVPPQPWLYTVAGLQALAASGQTSVASDATLPGGIPLAQILKTDGTLVVRPALADQYAASFVTTEVWVGYPQVWVQPMYVPVSGWVNGAPAVITDAATGAWKPVYSVGPDSGFYSPFWQLFYFDAPAGTTADTFTSVKQILDAGLPLHEAGGWTIPIVPADLTWTGSAAIAETGWVDGGAVSTLDFGERLFTWNRDGNVVDEVPLFLFVTRDPDGQLVVPDLPPVAGTGPIGSGGPAPPASGTQPLYSSYWRLYTVEIPASAVVFPPAAAALNPEYAGRLVTTPDCLADPNDVDPEACSYLDSQRAIERGVAREAIRATDVTVTAPFVTYRNGATIVPVFQ